MEKKVIKKSMATKMAKSGLHLRHLRQAFNHGGQEGLTGLMTEPSGRGSVRVTKDRQILDSIVQFFKGSSDTTGM